MFASVSFENIKIWKKNKEFVVKLWKYIKEKQKQKQN